MNVLGRRAARELGLRATGLLGGLLRAKDARLLDAISPVISELEELGRVACQELLPDPYFP